MLTLSLLYHTGSRVDSLFINLCAPFCRSVFELTVTVVRNTSIQTFILLCIISFTGGRGKSGFDGKDGSNGKYILVRVCLSSLSSISDKSIPPFSVYKKLYRRIHLFFIQMGSLKPTTQSIYLCDRTSQIPSNIFGAKVSNSFAYYKYDLRRHKIYIG